MARKILLVAVSLILGYVLLVFLLGGFAVTVLAFSDLLGIQRSLGIDGQASKNYAFVSGSGPMFIAALGFTGLVVTAVHHLNCHQAGCPRVGRYPVAGGEYKVCRRHHPDPQIKEGVSAAHLLSAHEKHQAR